MFCDKCGAMLEAGAKFCSVCGSAAGNAQTTQQGQGNEGNQDSPNLGNGANNNESGWNGSYYTANGNGYNNNTGFNENNNGYNSANTGYNTNMSNNSQGYNNSNNQGYNTAYNNNNTGYNTANNSSNGFNSGYANFQPASPVPKSKKPVFVAILAVVLVIAILTASYFTIGKNLLLKRNPVKRTINAVTSIAGAKAVDSSTVIKLKLTGDSSALISAVADQMAIKVDSKYNSDKSQGEFKFAFVIKEQSILDFNMYADKDIVVITSDGLLDKPLYFKTKDINKLAGEQGAAAPSLEDYTAYENFFKNVAKSDNYKAMSKDYSKFFEDVLKEFTKKTGSVDVKVVENGKTRTISCDETTLTIDENFVKQVIKGVLDKVSTDKNLKALIKDKANEFVALAKKNGDLKKLDIDEDSFKEAMSKFDANWDDAMKGIKDGMGEIDTNLEDFKLDSTAKFRIDSSNRLRELSYEISGGDAIGTAMNMPGVGGSVIIDTVFNAYDGDVKVTKPSTQGAANLAEMDQFELMSLMGQIEEKLQKAIGSKLGGL